MRQSFLTIVLLLLVLPLVAQNKLLRGQVFLQNSNFKKIEGVKISAFGANTTYSSSSGEFLLEFKDHQPGDPIKLMIGSTNKQGGAIELINEREINSLRLPSEATDTLSVLVCEAGKRDSIAQVYYKILRTAADRALEVKRTELRALKAERAKDAQRILVLTSELDSLENNYYQNLRKIEEQALYIASINLDQASSLVRNAIKKIEEEQDIEAALMILEDDKLEQAYANAIDKKIKAENEIRQVIEGFELKCNLLKTEFRITLLPKYYNRIIEIYQANELNSDKLAYYFNELANAYLYTGAYQKARTNYELALDKEKEVFEEPTRELATYTANIGLIHQIQGDFQQSLDYGEKAYQIAQDALTADDPYMAGYIYAQMRAYYSMGKYSEALQLQQEVLEIAEADTAKIGREMVHLYLYMEDIQNAIGNFKTGQVYLEKARVMALDSLSSSDYLLADVYGHQGAEHLNKGNFEEALNSYKKALKIYLEVYGKKSPNLIDSYTNLLYCYMTVWDYDQALEIGEEIKKIAQFYETLVHPTKIKINESLSDLNYRLKNYDLAKNYAEESLKDALEIYGDNHLIIVSIYNDLAKVYTTTDSLKQAITVQEEALRICKDMAVNMLTPVVRESYLQYGRILNDLGRYEEAQAVFEELYKVAKVQLDQNNPIFSDIYAGMSRSASLMEEYDKALAYMDSAALVIKTYFSSKHPIFNTYNSFISTIFAGKGYKFFQSKSYQQAFELFEEALTYDSTNFDAIYWQSLCLANLDRKGESKALIEWVISESPEQIRFYGLRGNYRYMEKNYQGAIQDYDVFLQHFTEDGSAYNYRGNSYFNLGKLKEALPNYEKAATLVADNAVYTSNVAEVHFKLNDFETAQIWFEKAIELNSKKADYHYKLAACHSRLQQYQEAKRAILNAIELEQGIDYYYNELGLYNYMIKEYQPSVDAMDKAIDLNQKNGYYYNMRGLSYYMLQQYEPAKTDFLASYKLIPQDYYNPYILGDIFFIERKYQEAIKWLDISLKKNPDYNMTISLKGLCLMELGRYEEADSLFDQALKKDKNLLVNYHNNKGINAIYRGELTAAKEHFESFAQLSELKDRIYRNWAIYYTSTGELKLAMDYLGQALENGYRDWDYLNQNPLFAPLREEKKFTKLLRKWQQKH